MGEETPGELVWYIEARDYVKTPGFAPGDPQAMGSAVVVELGMEEDGVKKSRKFLLTCGHVVRKMATAGKDRDGWGEPLRELCCFRPGTDYARMSNDERRSGKYPGARLADVHVCSPFARVPGEVPEHERNESDDWALLDVRGNKLQGFPAVKIWGKAEVGKKVSLYGYPGGAGTEAEPIWNTDDKVTCGGPSNFSVKEVDDQMLSLHGDATRPGMSGCGIFSEDGQTLLGIHREARNRALERHGISIEHIKKALWESKMWPIAQPPPERGALLTPGLFGRAEDIQWVKKRIDEDHVRLLIAGDPGIGTTKILKYLCRHLPDPRPALKVHSLIECKFLGVAKPTFEDFKRELVRLVSPTGNQELLNSSAEKVLKDLERHFKENDCWLLIDDFDALYEHLNEKERRILDKILPDGSARGGVIFTSKRNGENLLKSFPVKRFLAPLTAGDMRLFFHNLCEVRSWQSTLSDGEIAKLVEACAGIPQRLRAAMDKLSGNDRSDFQTVLDEIERGDGHSTMTALTREESMILAALDMLPSHDWDAARYIVCEGSNLMSREAFDKACEELSRRHPLPAPAGIQPTACESTSRPGSPSLSRDETAAYVASLLEGYNADSPQVGEQEKSSLRAGLKKWVFDLLLKSPDWQRDREQYDRVRYHVKDLKLATEDLPPDPPVTAEPAVSSAYVLTIDHMVEIAEIVHRVGTWDDAATLMKKLLAVGNNAQRIRLWLLLARHHSYRGENEDAERCLKNAETLEDKIGSSKMAKVQVRLRSGQARRRTDPATGMRDLQYAMDQGTTYDYLVAAGFVADMYMDKEEDENARAVLESAMTIQDNLPLPWERIRAHHHRLLGEIAALRGSWTCAHRHFKAARDGSEWARDLRLLGWAKLGLALCTGEEATAQEAEEYLRPLDKNVAEHDLLRARQLTNYLRQRDGSRPQPPIVFIGGPGAGKTTLRNRVLRWLVKEGIPAFPTGIEEAQRQLYPPENPRRDPYHYDDAGALCLDDPDLLIPFAYDLLARTVAARSHPHVIPLVEFTHPDAVFAFGKFDEGTMRDARVLMLNAPLDIRLGRNRRRQGTPAHVSDEVVRKFEVNRDANLGQYLAGRGARLTELDASRSTDENFESAKNYIKGQWPAWFEKNGRA